MEYKKDYFIRNARDFKTPLAKYIKEGKDNYVLVPRNGKDEPVIWVSDKEPVIYGGVEDVCRELENNISNPDEMMYITEYEFIMKYCMSAIEKAIIDKVVSDGENDGVCYTHGLDSKFNGRINMNGCTDILSIYVPMEGKWGVSILCASEDDKTQLWFSLSDFVGKYDDVVLDILSELFN